VNGLENFSSDFEFQLSSRRIDWYCSITLDARGEGGCFFCTCFIAFKLTRAFCMLLCFRETSNVAAYYTFEYCILLRVLNLAKSANQKFQWNRYI